MTLREFVTALRDSALADAADLSRSGVVGQQQEQACREEARVLTDVLDSTYPVHAAERHVIRVAREVVECEGARAQHAALVSLVETVGFLEDAIDAAKAGAALKLRNAEERQR